jgi:hypothetical protein
VRQAGYSSVSRPALSCPSLRSCVRAGSLSPGGRSISRADEAASARGRGCLPRISARRGSGCGARAASTASVLQLRVRARTHAARQNACTERNHEGTVYLLSIFPYSMSVTLRLLLFDVCACRLKREGGSW